MAAREVKLWTGTQFQSAVDSAETVVIPIKSGGRKAVQIYAVEFAVSLGVPILPLVDATITVALVNTRSSVNFVTFHDKRWYLGNGSGMMMLTDVWDAPPTLYAVGDSIEISFETTGFTTENALIWTVYYKDIKLTVQQELQLLLMK